MATTLVQNWKLLAAWAVISLAIVGALTAAAEQRAPFLTVAPQLVSGRDIGFRIERTVDGVPIDKLVVRVEGRRVDVAEPSTSGSAAR
jgi:hypothetical protein